MDKGFSGSGRPGGVRDGGGGLCALYIAFEISKQKFLSINSYLCHFRHISSKRYTATAAGTGLAVGAKANLFVLRLL